MNLVSGNLLDLADQGQFDAIMHGCNCFGVMGAGIALQIANRYPDARTADLHTVKGDPGKLGTYTLGLHKGLLIINVYSQYSMAQSGGDVFEYLAFQRALDRIAERWGHLRIGLPMIGMGLAGGDSQRILGMIDAFSQRVERLGGSVTLVEYKRG